MKLWCGEEDPFKPARGCLTVSPGRDSKVDLSSLFTGDRNQFPRLCETAGSGGDCSSEPVRIPHTGLAAQPPQREARPGAQLARLGGASRQAHGAQPAQGPLPPQTCPDVL